MPEVVAYRLRGLLAPSRFLRSPSLKLCVNPYPIRPLNDMFTIQHDSAAFSGPVSADACYR